MNNFKQFLTEGRFAPLYHSIDITYVPHILKYNVLSAMNRNISNSGKQKMPLGISLTRDFSLVCEFRSKLTNVIFEFDQIKISYNNKIVPFNWYDSEPSARNSMTEYEEYVIGDIKNIDRKITKIIIDEEDCEQMIYDMGRNLLETKYKERVFLKNYKTLNIREIEQYKF